MVDRHNILLAFCLRACLVQDLHKDFTIKFDIFETKQIEVIFVLILMQEVLQRQPKFGDVELS